MKPQISCRRIGSCDTPSTIASRYAKKTGEENSCETRHVVHLPPDNAQRSPASFHNKRDFFSPQSGVHLPSFLQHRSASQRLQLPLPVLSLGGEGVEVAL